MPVVDRQLRRALTSARSLTYAPKPDQSIRAVRVRRSAGAPVQPLCRRTGLLARPPDSHGCDVLGAWVKAIGTRILELSTKCTPAEALNRAFLEDCGVDLGGKQHTQTKTALEFFASELTAIG